MRAKIRAPRPKRHFDSIIAKLVVITVVAVNGVWAWALGWGIWRGLKAIVGSI